MTIGGLKSIGKMCFRRKFIAVPYLWYWKHWSALHVWNANINIHMNIYVEHMTYNRIMHKGSILCADYESGMFFFYQIRKMKKNLSSSDHISAFVRSLNAFKSTGSFVICVILQKANINYRIKCKMQQIALTMGLVRDYDNAIIMLVTSSDRCIRLNEMVSKATIMITIVIDYVFVRFYSQERHNLYGR